MEVLRDGVVLAVCPECLGTFLAPGELEKLAVALARKFAAQAPDALRRLLDPEPPSNP